MKSYVEHTVGVLGKNARQRCGVVWCGNPALTFARKERREKEEKKEKHSIVFLPLNSLPLLPSQARRPEQHHP